MVAEIRPTAWFAIGAANVLKLSISCWMSGAAGWVRVTIVLSAVTSLMSLVLWSSLKPMLVTSRPNELALVTGRPSIRLLLAAEQTYGWCVWPVTKRSTASLVRSTMSVIAPATLHWSMPANGDGVPPSCSSTTIARTCFLRSLAAYLFAVSASSRNSTSWIPDAETMFGVPSRVIPMKPTLMCSNFLIA